MLLIRLLSFTCTGKGEEKQTKWRKNTPHSKRKERKKERKGN
jgi:hypothetical protein